MAVAGHAQSSEARHRGFTKPDVLLRQWLTCQGVTHVTASVMGVGALVVPWQTLAELLLF